MNPFSTPDRLFISKRPQDMRAGMQRLASIITTDFDMDPTDGALYIFVSRDCEKVKALRFETDGWCLYYIRLCEGGFRWTHRPWYDKGSRIMNSVVFARTTESFQLSGTMR